jgi:hypothetical protein
MRRKSILLTFGAVLLLLGATGTALALMVRHVPNFYRERAIPPGPAREQQSNAFLREFTMGLFDPIQNERKSWHASFTEAQINSYFQEGLLKSGWADKLFPESISDPRVALEDNAIRVAFRYGNAPWSTIISINVRLWLAPKEVNVVALELQGLHAGALPISAQSLLVQISEIAKRRNVDVTWYRHNGNPVALLRFQGERRQPTVQLRHLEVKDGRITFVGGSSDRTPRIGAAAAPPLTPQAN